MGVLDNSVAFSLAWGEEPGMKRALIAITAAMALA